MHILRILLPVAACVLASQAAPVLAQSSIGSSMATGAITSQPIGHYEFCETHGSECRRTGTAQPMPLIDATFSLLDAVNRQVNSTITAVTDAQLYNQAEVWAYPTTAGDCEDFVLLKRKMLADAGWPLSDLLITMVLQANGEGHAVLTVRTDRGDFILDNLSNEVRLWTDTPYIYVKRQSDRDAGSWVTISGSTWVAGSRPEAAPPTPSGQLGVIGTLAVLGNIAN